MKIGILQTGLVPEGLARDHGEFPSMFERFLAGHGLEFANYPVVEGVFPSSVTEQQGWLITGSRHAAYEDHPWIGPLENFIRETYAASVPMVGICFGHQIIAQALGGKVRKFDGIWGVGNRTYQHKDGSTSTLLAMHQDQVTELPEDAEVIASAEYCENAILSYKDKMLTIQPHPEFTPEFVREIIEERRGVSIPVDQAEDGMRDLELDNDSKRFAQEIAEFFKRSAAKQEVGQEQYN